MPTKEIDVKLTYTRSPSADVTSRKIAVTKNGTTTTYDVGPEVSEFVLQVRANESVQVQTTVFDSEGRQASSEIATFTAGDLTDPLPDTNLFLAPVGDVRDVPDETAA